MAFNVRKKIRDRLIQKISQNDTMAEEIFKSALSLNKKIKIFSNSAHGTTILARNEGFSREIIEWLKAIYV